MAISLTDVEKLQKLSGYTLEHFPIDCGRNFVTFKFWPDFKSGTICFLLNWKCDNGEIDFKDLDQALAALVRKLVKE